MKKFFLLLFCLFAFSGYAQKQDKTGIPDFNGYIQVRAASNFDSYTGFALRRLKLWLKSKPGFSDHWSYKVQVTFSSYAQEKIFLQDVFLQYKWRNSELRFGQFVPRYSLERFQHDYLIAPLERARAVNILIPNGTIGVRDLGLQYNLRAVNNRLLFNMGLFNGFGIKTYQFNNKGYMITQNISYEIPVSSSSIKVGFSTMFRKAENLYLIGILPDTVAYTGNEFRFNVYGLFSSRFVDVQGEYLQAKLQNTTAYGYYGLATVKLNENNHLYLMYDRYQNEYSSSLSNPWYIAGYNYFFKGYKIMLTFQTGFQQSNSGWENRTSLQFQMFFK